jgi:hypothetical protein
LSINLIDLSEIAWHEVSTEWPGNRGGDSSVRYKPFASELPAAPAGQLVRFEAGYTEPVHSHDEDEVFILLEGDLSIEAETGGRLGPGSVAFISANSEYSPRTESGCVYLRLGLTPRNPADQD